MLELKITNEQKVPLTVAPVTATGKSALLDGDVLFTVQSGDATIERIDATSAWLISGEVPGDSVIVVSADADLGEGVEPITDLVKLTVEGARAQSLGLVAGTPVAKLIALLLTLGALLIPSAHAEEAPAELYAAGKFTLTPFTAARVENSHADFGGGLAASYTLTRRLAVEGDLISEGIDDSNWQDSITEAGAALKYYFPIKETGFAPYLIGGYKRDLIAHENRLAAGAGLEYRQGHACLFADAKLNHGFEEPLSRLGNRVDVRLGVGWRW